MKQNIGTINALIRITLGLVLFGCSATKLVRKPWCTWSNILLWIGAMKVAEGIVRFCPVVEMWKFGKYMNMGAFKMPSMNFAEKGHTKEEVNQTSNHDKPQSNGSYDASDKEIESAIEDIIRKTALNHLSRCKMLSKGLSCCSGRLSLLYFITKQNIHSYSKC